MHEISMQFAAVLDTFDDHRPRGSDCGERSGALSIHQPSAEMLMTLDGDEWVATVRRKSPAARRRRVATTLFAHNAREARRRVAQLLFLPAPADDTLRAMYAAMGFTPTGIAWNWLLLHEE